MKIATLRKFQTKLMRRRNMAARQYRGQSFNPWDRYRARTEGVVEALDLVLDDLDRLIKNNHDRFHDRRRRA